jgi:hypothetical protein
MAVIFKRSLVETGARKWRSKHWEEIRERTGSNLGGSLVLVDNGGLAEIQLNLLLVDIHGFGGSRITTIFHFLFARWFCSLTDGGFFRIS